MNLHFLPDSKFFPSLVNLIQRNGLTINNKFVVISTNKTDKLYFLGNYENLEIINSNIAQRELNLLTYKYDKIIFHNLSKDYLSILCRIKKNKAKIIWRPWTTDTYSFLQINKQFHALDLETEKLILQLKNIGFLPLSLVKWGRISKAILMYARTNEALGKIDIVTNWNSFETNILEKHYPKFRAQYVFSNYIIEPIPDEFSKKLNVNEKRSVGIMIGHSGYPIGNHYDIFINLKAHFKDEYDYKIICPLSYGQEDYIKMINHKGIELFGEKYLSISEFLPIKKYYALINKIDIFIFNHKIPIAAGNINELVRSGKKLFLREDNPHFQFLREIGIVIFSISSITKITWTDFINPLNKEQKIQNNRIIESYFNSDRIEKSLLKIIT